MTPVPDRIATAIASVLRHESGRDHLVFRVEGTCMGSLLTPGGCVRVRVRPRYWPGDIVVARCADIGFRVHRIIGAYPS